MPIEQFVNDYSKKHELELELELELNEIEGYHNNRMVIGRGRLTPRRR